MAVYEEYHMIMRTVKNSPDKRNASSSKCRFGRFFYLGSFFTTPFLSMCEVIVTDSCVKEFLKKYMYML